MIWQALLIKKSASLKFLDIVCGIRSSQNADEQNVKGWLQHDKREIRQSQTLLMLLQNRSVRNRTVRMRIKQEVVKVSVTAWQYSVLILCSDAWVGQGSNTDALQPPGIWILLCGEVKTVQRNKGLLQTSSPKKCQLGIRQKEAKKEKRKSENRGKKTNCGVS